MDTQEIDHGANIRVSMSKYYSELLERQAFSSHSDRCTFRQGPGVTGTVPLDLKGPLSGRERELGVHFLYPFRPSGDIEDPLACLQVAHLPLQCDRAFVNFEFEFGKAGIGQIALHAGEQGFVGDRRRVEH